MNNLKAKLKKQGGFTLIEMLIVVAIIAILIAIAIPMVNVALESAREATDSANERSALGVAMVEVMSKNTLGGKAIADDPVDAFYKIGQTGSTDTAAAMGVLVGTKGSDASFKYGKGTAAGDNSAVNTGKCIKVTYTPTESDPAQQYKVAWD